MYTLEQQFRDSEQSEDGQGKEVCTCDAQADSDS